MSAFRHLCVDWRDGGKLKECRRHAVKLEQGFGHVLGRLCLLILERRQLYFARGVIKSCMRSSPTRRHLEHLKKS